MDFKQVIAEIQELKGLIFPSDCYMAFKDLAHYSGLSKRKLRELLHHPLYPLPSYKIEGSIRVKKSEFDIWVKRFRLIPEENTDLDGLVNDVMKGLQRV